MLIYKFSNNNVKNRNVNSNRHGCIRNKSWQNSNNSKASYSNSKVKMGGCVPSSNVPQLNWHYVIVNCRMHRPMLIRHGRILIDSMAS